MTRVPSLPRAEAVRRLQSGRFVTVSFIARSDNRLRTLNGQYSKSLRVTGHDCIALLTRNGDRRGGGLCRNVPIEGIIAISVDGKTYRVGD